MKSLLEKCVQMPVQIFLRRFVDRYLYGGIDRVLESCSSESPGVWAIRLRNLELKETVINESILLHTPFVLLEGRMDMLLLRWSIGNRAKRAVEVEGLDLTLEFRPSSPFKAKQRSCTFKSEKTPLDPPAGGKKDATTPGFFARTCSFLFEKASSEEHTSTDECDSEGEGEAEAGSAIEAGVDALSVELKSQLCHLVEGFGARLQHVTVRLRFPVMGEKGSSEFVGTRNADVSPADSISNASERRATHADHSLRYHQWHELLFHVSDSVEMEDVIASTFGGNDGASERCGNWFSKRIVSAGVRVLLSTRSTLESLQSSSGAGSEESWRNFNAVESTAVSPRTSGESLAQSQFDREDGEARASVREVVQFLDIAQAVCATRHAAPAELSLKVEYRYDACDPAVGLSFNQWNFCGTIGQLFVVLPPTQLSRLIGIFHALQGCESNGAVPPTAPRDLARSREVSARDEKGHAFDMTAECLLPPSARVAAMAQCEFVTVVLPLNEASDAVRAFWSERMEPNAHAFPTLRRSALEKERCDVPPAMLNTPHYRVQIQALNVQLYAPRAKTRAEGDQYYELFHQYGEQYIGVGVVRMDVTEHISAPLFLPPLLCVEPIPRKRGSNGPRSTPPSASSDASVTTTESGFVGEEDPSPMVFVMRTTRPMAAQMGVAEECVGSVGSTDKEASMPSFLWSSGNTNDRSLVVRQDIFLFTNGRLAGTLDAGRAQRLLEYARKLLHDETIGGFISETKKDLDETDNDPSRCLLLRSVAVVLAEVQFDFAFPLSKPPSPSYYGEVTRRVFDFYAQAERPHHQSREEKGASSAFLSRRARFRLCSVDVRGSECVRHGGATLVLKSAFFALTESCSEEETILLQLHFVKPGIHKPVVVIRKPSKSPEAGSHASSLGSTLSKELLFLDEPLRQQFEASDITWLFAHATKIQGHFHPDELWLSIFLLNELVDGFHIIARQLGFEDLSVQSRAQKGAPSSTPDTALYDSDLLFASEEALQSSSVSKLALHLRIDEIQVDLFAPRLGPNGVPIADKLWCVSSTVFSSSFSSKSDHLERKKRLESHLYHRFHGELLASSVLVLLGGTEARETICCELMTNGVKLTERLPKLSPSFFRTTASETKGYGLPWGTSVTLLESCSALYQRFSWNDDGERPSAAFVRPSIHVSVQYETEPLQNTSTTRVRCALCHLAALHLPSHPQDHWLLSLLEFADEGVRTGGPAWRAATKSAAPANEGTNRKEADAPPRLSTISVAVTLHDFFFEYHPLGSSAAAVVVLPSFHLESSDILSTVTPARVVLSMWMEECRGASTSSARSSNDSSRGASLLLHRNHVCTLLQLKEQYYVNRSSSPFGVSRHGLVEDLKLQGFSRVGFLTTLHSMPAARRFASSTTAFSATPTDVVGFSVASESRHRSAPNVLVRLHDVDQKPLLVEISQLRGELSFARDSFLLFGQIASHVTSDTDAIHVPPPFQFLDEYRGVPGRKRNATPTEGVSTSGTCVVMKVNHYSEHIKKALATPKSTRVVKPRKCTTLRETLFAADSADNGRGVGKGRDAKGRPEGIKGSTANGDIDDTDASFCIIDPTIDVKRHPKKWQGTPLSQLAIQKYHFSRFFHGASQRDGSGRPLAFASTRSSCAARSLRGYPPIDTEVVVSQCDVDVTWHSGNDFFERHDSGARSGVTRTWINKEDALDQGRRHSCPPRTYSDYLLLSARGIFVQLDWFIPRPHGSSSYLLMLMHEVEIVDNLEGSPVRSLAACAVPAAFRPNHGNVLELRWETVNPRDPLRFGRNDDLREDSKQVRTFLNCTPPARPEQVVSLRLQPLQFCLHRRQIDFLLAFLNDECNALLHPPVVSLESTEAEGDEGMSECLHCTSEEEGFFLVKKEWGTRKRKESEREGESRRVCRHRNRSDFCGGRSDCCGDPLPPAGLSPSPPLYFRQLYIHPLHAIFNVQFEIFDLQRALFGGGGGNAAGGESEGGVDAEASSGGGARTLALVERCNFLPSLERVRLEFPAMLLTSVAGEQIPGKLAEVMGTHLRRPVALYRLLCGVQPLYSVDELLRALACVLGVGQSGEPVACATHSGNRWTHGTRTVRQGLRRIAAELVRVVGGAARELRRQATAGATGGPPVERGDQPRNWKDGTWRCGTSALEGGQRGLEKIRSGNVVQIPLGLLAVVDGVLKAGAELSLGVRNSLDPAGGRREERLYKGRKGNANIRMEID